MASGTVLPERPPDPIVEKRQQGDQLGRRTGLRRNEKKRPPEVKPCGRLGHRAGLGRVEDLELKAAGRREEHAGEDLGGQARAAHAQDDGPGEPFGPDRGGERLHIRRRPLSPSAGRPASRGGWRCPHDRPSKPSCRDPRCGGRRRPARARRDSGRAPAPRPRIDDVKITHSRQVMGGSLSGRGDYISTPEAGQSRLIILAGFRKIGPRMARSR